MSGTTESAAGVAEGSRWASVELPAPLAPRPEIGFVLFDFDGTLSIIRQGWPEVMVPMFVEMLPGIDGFGVLTALVTRVPVAVVGMPRSVMMMPTIMRVPAEVSMMIVVMIGASFGTR